MAKLVCTSDVRFNEFTEAGLFMLNTLRILAAKQPMEAVFITAATNGVHSGPADPHYAGNAFDVRTHNFPTRADRFMFCDRLLAALGPLFYAFVEDPDKANEHIHVQVKNGCHYPAPLPAPLAPVKA